MKEVEIINSRDEHERSQQNSNDSNVSTSNATCTSFQTGEAPILSEDERKSILPVLENCTDTLAIYRFTLDNRIHRRNVKENVEEEDLTRDEGIIKLCEDSFYVNNLLEDLIEDVQVNGSYNVLIREIEDNRKRSDSETATARDYAEARKSIELLRKLMRDETKANSREINELKIKLARSKNEKKRLELKVGIEARYVRAREKARCEGNSIRCGIKLEELEDKLKNLEAEEKNECRVAEDIENFLKQNMTENKIAASQWQKRHEHEMLMYASENERLLGEIENRRQALGKLQFEYREKQEYIDVYLAEQEELEEIRRCEEYRINCGIRIQAWWRGVMVRRKLGPYRPQKKKKGKK